MEMSETKQELQRYIESISEDDPKAVLTFFRQFIRSPYPVGEPMTPEEAEAFKRGEEEIAKGEYLTMEEVRQGKTL